MRHNPQNRHLKLIYDSDLGMLKNYPKTAK